MFDANKAIKDVAEFGDKAFESNEEAEDARSGRHQVDTTSPFKLPHLIRPVSFIWAMANETILTWATIFVVFFMKDVDVNASNTLMIALAANTTILTTIVGFYFNSRKVEKNTAKKVSAAIKIEEIKIKEEIRKDKAEERRLKKLERRERRDSE